ncbi:hypothetical protein LK463_00845 [Corynebacterium diphtheriae]|nr:hypothetical protein LK463_00845 [Corynebacterium diphtheriae]
MVKKIVIPASIAALVALGGGATYFLTAGSSDPVVGASDYAVVEKKEVSQSINLSGTLLGFNRWLQHCCFELIVVVH